jgi:hypothetical protein
MRPKKPTEIPSEASQELRYGPKASRPPKAWSYFDPFTGLPQYSKAFLATDAGLAKALEGMGITPESIIGRASKAYQRVAIRNLQSRRPRPPTEAQVKAQEASDAKRSKA